MASYRALTGLSYGNKKVAAGEIMNDVPAKSIKWLRDQGLIEQVDSKGLAVDSSDVEPQEAEADVRADPKAKRV
jgi:hypothetical protein